MPVTSHAAIRAKIKTMMEAVNDAGIVHDHEVHKAHLSEIKAAYVSGSRIKGWYIERMNVARKQPYLGRVIVDTKWRLTHLRGVEEADATALALDTHIDAAQQAFQANQTLDGVVDSTWLTEQDNACGLQHDSTEFVMFCGVLCHRARCTLFTRHKE